MKTILFTESQWRNSPLSVARMYGGINYNGQNYTIVNEQGKDLFRCSEEALRDGREYAIAPGQPADLVNDKYLKEYRKLGRDKFFEKYNLRKD